MRRIQLFFIFFIAFVPFLSATANDSAVDIHGFISQGYLKTNHNNFLADTEEGTFQYNELGINFVSQIQDTLRLGLQIFSRDLGDLGNNDISLAWAYADCFISDAIGVRAGIMKIPHGFYNESRDSDMMRTSIFLPQGMYNEAWRDSFISIKGVSVYGHLWDHLSYQLQVGKLEAPLEGGLVKLFNGMGIGDVDSINSESRPCYIANFQLYDIIEGLKIGTSVMNWEFLIHMTYSPGVDLKLPIPEGTKGLVDGSATVWSTGVEYNYNSINFSSEYVILSWDMPTNFVGFEYLIENIDDFFPQYSILTFDMLGWYVNFSYRMNDWLELGIMYSEFYWDKGDKDGSAYEEGILNHPLVQPSGGAPSYWRYQKNTTISFRFDINENWVVKFEADIVNGVGICARSDNQKDDLSYDFKKNWLLFAAKVMYSF